MFIARNAGEVLAEHTGGKTEDPFGMQTGVRPLWAMQVGKPHPTGIKLNVLVRLPPSDKIDNQIRGVVDVPGHPFGDEERCYLAKVLIEAVDDIPQCKFEYQVVDWVATEGGKGIQVAQCRPIAVSVGRDFVNLRVFEPPDIQEPLENSQISAEQQDEWIREYAANRYCRYLTRQELNQRFQDLLVNIQVLTPSGRLGLSTDETWYRLLQHVIDEMQFRGEPPTASNHHPHVQRSRPFFDGEFCRKAAKVVAASSTDQDVLVKYGKREHMYSLFQRGIVYLNPATWYSASDHNQAIEDNELAIGFKGGFIRTTRPLQFYDRNNAPPMEIAARAVGFRTIYELPELHSDQFCTATIQAPTDYWMFCMADILDPRLFADFQADCCLIIKRRPFAERLLRTAAEQLTNETCYFDRVQYVDPLGAWPASTHVTNSIPLHMTKVFRYAYQREARFAIVPNEGRDDLQPREIEVGSISDIADLVPLMG
ncbi:hypothetical protein [Candidatus Foliamicus sp.]